MKTRAKAKSAIKASAIVMATLAFALSFASQGFAAEAGAPSPGGFAMAPAASTTSEKVSLSSCQISLASALRYTAKPLCPEPAVSYQGKQLVKGQDFDVSYKNNKGIGTATAVVSGKGAYDGEVARTFKIEYSNVAIAVAACRLSYSKAWTKGHAVSKQNGYRGTPMYKKYAETTSFNCSRVVRMSIARYLKVDRKFPDFASTALYHMKSSKNWKKVCRYRPGMEFKKNNKLRPGDVYANGHHICMYVGNEVPRIVYKDYLKANSKTKKKLKKSCADLGKPSKRAVWVSSHAMYMNGSAAHICGRGDALAEGGGYLFRYVGKPKKIRASLTR